MLSSEIVELTTRDNVIHTGLWMEQKQPDTCYIFIHGLGGNVFSMRELANHLVTDSTSVLLFNNRGHDIISRIKKIDTREKKGTVSFLGGAAHEVFTDCVNDIAGAVEYAKSRGTKHIILVGHSTGSQKAIFYASKKQNEISGIVLLSPLSDFAGIIKNLDLTTYKNLLKISESLVEQGEEHQLLPHDMWPPLADAQRFLSLATPMSEEEIFSYYDPGKTTVYSKITVPLLVLFGLEDEYRDRPISEICEWFDTHQNSKLYQSAAIAEGTHGFDAKEKDVAKYITDWTVKLLA